MSDQKKTIRTPPSLKYVSGAPGATPGCDFDTLRIMEHFSMTTRDVDVKSYTSNKSNWNAEEILGGHQTKRVNFLS